jgi:catechol 2,3-dioxygenase-like lactoylglutathione lyase family enzyme
LFFFAKKNQKTLILWERVRVTLILYTTLGVTDLDRSAAFYDAVFATIGCPRAPQTDDAFPSWGPDYGGGVSFAICRPFDGQPPSAGNGSMIALRATNADEVIAFHAAALAHGGTCDGPPGLRPHYTPTFFAAYIRDPDGNKLACVCHNHQPEAS